MLEELKAESNRTLTENGAATHISTGSHVLDLFATAGALRSAPEGEIALRFARAWAEDRDLAMKLAFYTRDIRGGLGERRVFRVILRWLAENEPASVLRSLELIAEYGRFDDLLTLLGTPCEGAAAEYIGRLLREDLAALEAGRPVSLLAKWLPSVNASSPAAVRLAKRLAALLGLREDRYRRTLSRLRRACAILENDLRERSYTFDYSKQPSGALFKYRRAFRRNDGERYGAFLESVERGEAVLHTGALTPYDIITPIITGRAEGADIRTLDVSWNALEDFTCGENALAVVDGSGSMYSGAPMPAAVAMSLGIYFAEHNTGAFRGHFITFSTTPRLVEIKGRDIADKVRYCMGFNEVADTDLQAVFELILSAALKNRLSQSDLPSRLYVISDMEFNRCVQNGDMTNFDYARDLFASFGYTLPQVVFWNVASRNRQQPVKMNDQGVTLVSGCTPRIFSLLASGTLDPMSAMLQVLNSPHYAPIAA